METANFTHHPEAHESRGYQTGFIDMLQTLIYASLCWSPNWKILKAVSSDTEGASQDYANNQHPRYPCARASRTSHTEFTMSSSTIKTLRKKFLFKAFFKIQWVEFVGVFFEMELSDFSSKQGSNTFFKKQNSTVSAHFKITPNATQSSGHFLSNYSKSCCTLSFTTESLTKINQSIHRFPKVHGPFHHHVE